MAANTAAETMKSVRRTRARTRSLTFPPNAREGQKDHERKRQRSNHDLRKGYVRRLEDEKHEGEEDAVKAGDNRLVERVARQHHGKPSRRDQGEDERLQKRHEEGSSSCQ